MYNIALQLAEADKVGNAPMMTDCFWCFHQLEGGGRDAAPFTTSRCSLPLLLHLQAEGGILADVQRKHGDHLYSKNDYDAAMAAYVATIGYLEPSYVIRRFLDVQRIHNLTHYLEQLHDARKANADHTTLLLNCFTKLKDSGKLDAFIRDNEVLPLPLAPSSSWPPSCVPKAAVLVL